MDTITKVQPLFNTTVVSQSNIVPVNKVPTLFNTATDIINYGADASAAVTKYNDSILSEINTSELPMFESSVINVLSIAKGITLPTDLENKGNFLTSLVNRIVNTREQVISKFTDLSSQIDKVVGEMDALSTKLTERNTMLDQLYVHNMNEYDNLEKCIITLESEIQYHQAALSEMKQQYSGDDVKQGQLINDKTAFIIRFEKRIDALKRIQLIAINTAPFIRLIQDNNLLLVEKFNDLTTLTIPAWKKQIMLYVSLSDQRKGVKVANAIDDATNALMRSNSDMLKQNTVDVYRASQRAVVDTETLQYVQDNLIATLTSVADITTEGRKSRQDAAVAIEKMKTEYMALASK
jgi:uncharacterized protein YaaN involved in tellurite resistance